jgi:hypothetical protein
MGDIGTVTNKRLDTEYRIIYTTYNDEERKMFKVTYDYKAKDGFLAEGEEFFASMKAAFAYINKLAEKYKLVGKPIIERVN